MHPLLIPFLLATYLSVSGTRKRSLSPSGGICAFIVGFVTMSVPVRAFGVGLIVLYLVGSKATKVGAARKRNMEEGRVVGGGVNGVKMGKSGKGAPALMDAGKDANEGGGYRDWKQVLCNSLSAVVAGILWAWSYANLGVNEVVTVYEPGKWCAVTKEENLRWSRALVFAMLGHFACCLGDTLSSELGILSRTLPRLITTLRRVPAGTNGGVSWLGLGASVLGGAIMGLTVGGTLWFENVACREGGVGFVGFVGGIVWWGVLGGLGGSLLDSLLGATIQRTKQSAKTNKILTDEVTPELLGLKEGEVRVVNGLDILTNNQVNLVSSIATSLVLGLLASETLVT